ncbi:MAG: hypothetical protein ACAI37_18610 [Chthoniobacter sp.]
MDFKQIAAHFRDESTPLVVTRVTIISDSGDFTGHGKLRRIENSLNLELMLDGEEKLPSIGGSYTQDQFWKIGGLIEGTVPFWGVSLPHEQTYHSARFTTRTAHFDFSRIHHLTVPFEDYEFRDAILRASLSPEEKLVSTTGESLVARLVDFKTVWTDTSTKIVEQNPFLGKLQNSRRDTLGCVYELSVRRGENVLKS